MEADIMTRDVRQMKTQLKQLSQPERAELAYFLLESIGPAEAGAAVAWEEELDRRVTEIQTGKAKGRPAEDVFAELRKAYP
jgi:putative addiction module component (TIGR02574 family)